jgi:hypothetical protein
LQSSSLRILVERYDQFLNFKIIVNMKKLIFAAVVALTNTATWAQTNTFPPSGNVGIGTKDPQTNLDVRGHAFFKNGSVLDISISTPGGKNGFAISPNEYGNYSRFNIVNYDNATVGDRYFQFKFNQDANGLTIRKGGNVGIGITNPATKLESSGTIRINSTTPVVQLFENDISDNNFQIDVSGGNLNFRTNNNSFSSASTKFTISNSGKVGIGTTDFSGGHKLRVEGTIGAREIKVQASGWTDFVFYDDYSLPTLEEVEQHINEHGHLPEIPSEAEVNENGINLGEMNAKLLQKIEELTLYLIDQNKEIKELKEKVQSLENN